jgi:1-acyl-sn-glycerol-3-phosphate acyltransferase
VAAMNLIRLPIRVGRLGVNILGGATYIESCYRLPRVSKIDSKELNDFGPFRYWVKDLVKSLNVYLEVEGRPVSQGNMMVSNHVSWVDTVILNHAEPLSFVSRHDVEGWPFIGTFTRRMGSVYVDRSNKFQAYRCIPNLQDKLRSGRSVMVFPESTTSDGTQLLPFYSMFLEAAVREKCLVQPVALTYTDKDGNRLREAAYAGDDSFGETLIRILKQRKVYAKIKFLAPFDAAVHDRKELVKLCRESIEKELY